TSTAWSDPYTESPTPSLHGFGWFIRCAAPGPTSSVPVGTRTRGETRNGRHRGAVRHDRRRWRAGGPVGGIPPEEAGRAVRDPGRKRAGRRLLADTLGLAAPVHAGALRRTPRLAVPGAGLVLPDQGRDGRLPGG